MEKRQYRERETVGDHSNQREGEVGKRGIYGERGGITITREKGRWGEREIRGREKGRIKVTRKKLR